MLTHQDVRLLEFEQQNPRRTGLKNDLILHRLGMSPAAYYGAVDRLVRRPDVQDRYPRIAARLERQAERRSAVRSGYDRLR